MKRSKVVTTKNKNEYRNELSRKDVNSNMLQTIENKKSQLQEEDNENSSENSLDEKRITLEGWNSGRRKSDNVLQNQGNNIYEILDNSAEDSDITTNYFKNVLSNLSEGLASLERKDKVKSQKKMASLMHKINSSPQKLARVMPEESIDNNKKQNTRAGHLPVINSRGSKNKIDAGIIKQSHLLRLQNSFSQCSTKNLTNSEISLFIPNNLKDKILSEIGHSVKRDMSNEEHHFFIGSRTLKVNYNFDLKRSSEGNSFNKDRKRNSINLTRAKEPGENNFHSLVMPRSQEEIAAYNYALSLTPLLKGEMSKKQYREYSSQRLQSSNFIRRLEADSVKRVVSKNPRSNTHETNIPREGGQKKANNLIKTIFYENDSPIYPTRLQEIRKSPTSKKYLGIHRHQLSRNEQITTHEPKITSFPLVESARESLTNHSSLEIDINKGANFGHLDAQDSQPQIDNIQKKNFASQKQYLNEIRKMSVGKEYDKITTKRDHSAFLSSGINYRKQILKDVFSKMKSEKISFISAKISKQIRSHLMK